MRTSRNTSDRKLFRKYMQEKLAITVLVVTLALFALVLVLYNIVKEKKDNYTQIVLSQHQQEYDSRTIPYKRGDIVDRNGTYLATSEKVYNLILDPTQIMAKPENYLDPTLEALGQCFQYDVGELRTLITEKKDKPYIRYAKQLTYEQKEAFEKLQEEMNAAYKASEDNAIKSKRVRGVWFEDEYKRLYPYGSLACNVVGFARKDGAEGTGGIEQYYNSTLIGNNGREYGYFNDDSNLERVIKPPSNGNTVVSTIDVNIQNMVEKRIQEWQDGIGSNRAAVIVMNPNNGEILAMATDKKFDLNNPRDLSAYYTEQEIEAMDEKAQAEAWNQMWRNFCVSDTYEPGSPQKIFTVAGAMEEGVINGGETFQCNGFLEVGGWPIKCVASRSGGHGLLDVEHGLMKSCNVVMMQIAQREGKERFSKYQKVFGFGARTGIDLPGEPSDADLASLVYNAEDMGPADLATNSFGQNYNCTMVQMAAAYCSVINGGSYYEPHVVKQVLNEQGSVVRKFDPILVRETVSENTANFIKEALFKNVSDDAGTAGAARVEGYQIGGKTGTAEKYPRKDKNYLVSFIGFAPVDNPEVVVYVVIDVPHLPSGPEQAHSSFASNVFGQIMGDILPSLNIFRDTDTSQAVDESMAQQQEGITSNTETEPQEGEAIDPGQETIPEETTADPGPKEEIADPGDENYGGYPGKMPGESAGDPPPATESAQGAAAESSSEMPQTGT